MPYNNRVLLPASVVVDVRTRTSLKRLFASRLHTGAFALLGHCGEPLLKFSTQIDLCQLEFFLRENLLFFCFILKIAGG